MTGSINMLPIEAANKSLSALWQRGNIISNNIANYDTPGFTAQSVSFEDQLQGKLSDNILTEQELSDIKPQVESVSNTGAAGSGTDTSGTSGNGVDIDSQLVELMRNQLQYNYLVRAENDGLNMLKSAASEGRK